LALVWGMASGRVLALALGVVSGRASALTLGVVSGRALALVLALEWGAAFSVGPFFLAVVPFRRPDFQFLAAAVSELALASGRAVPVGLAAVLALVQVLALSVTSGRGAMAVLVCAIAGASGYTGVLVGHGGSVVAFGGVGHSSGAGSSSSEAGGSGGRQPPQSARSSAIPRIVSW